MTDTLLKPIAIFDANRVRVDRGLEGDYVVATLHRSGNVYNPADIVELVGLLHG